MNKIKYLFPHSFLYLGWGLFAFAWIFFFASLYVFNTLRLISQNYNHYSTFILMIIFYLSALFVALSKEKQEDEYIMRERANSIVLVGYVYLVLFVFLGILQSLNTLWHFLDIQSYYKLKLLGTPFLMFVLYVAIFRIKMFRLRRALRNAE